MPPRPRCFFTCPARAARPSFPTRPPPARRAHRFPRVPRPRPAAGGGVPYRVPLSPARKPRSGRFFTCPPRPRCFFTCPARAARPPFPTRPPPAPCRRWGRSVSSSPFPRPRGAATVFPHAPARALPPVGACRIRAPLSPPRGAPIVSHTSPARAPRCFSHTSPPARPRPPFFHTPPARALPPVGACRIEFLFPRLRGAPASPPPTIFPHALHPAHPCGY